MTASQTKDLSHLFKHLRGVYAGAACPLERPCIDSAEPVVDQFVRSFLLWESTSAKAAAAMKRVEQAVVDFNELRVCMPGELIRIIGERYPRVEERARRLRSALHAVYARQHRVGLEHLNEMSKREARDYLESLDGTPRFVAARVALVCLGGHAAPIDGRILRRLADRGATEANATPETASAMLERKVRAGEMLEAYALLQAWSDDPSGDVADGKPHKDEARAAGRSRGASRTGARARRNPGAAEKE
ncbi:MAG: hypothetical protein KF699_08115 [Phycisphaeraceae bacterium]|nr:hypothetical protein [Phycisphaeraceae bacterium]MBX3406234.1 hypothetical protein [Phycisphaeraceae bacterium]